MVEGLAIRTNRKETGVKCVGDGDIPKQNCGEGYSAAFTKVGGFCTMKIIPQ